MDRTLLKRGLAPAICITISVNAFAQDHPGPMTFGIPMPMITANESAVITIDDVEDDAAVNDAQTQPTGATDQPTSVGEDEAPATTPKVAAENIETQSPPLATFSPPIHETKSLGVPNSIFSARPVESKAASIATETIADGENSGETNAILASIDPRTSPISRVLCSLGLVLLLLFGLKSLMKRGAGFFGQVGRPSGVLEILARYPLDRKQSLVVLKLARRVLLLHQNGSQMTTLSEITEPIEVASLLSRIEAGSSGKQAQRFQSMLKRFEAEHDSARRRNEREDLFPALENDGENKVVDLTRRQRRLPIASQRRTSA